MNVLCKTRKRSSQEIVSLPVGKQNFFYFFIQFFNRQIIVNDCSRYARQKPVCI